jgi:hypothetical protein
MITLTSCNRLLKLSVLGTEAVVFLLETLGYILEGDVTLDLALLIELYACLKLSKLRLLAFSKGALCGSSGDNSISMSRFKSTDKIRYLFWTRLPPASGI